MALRAWKALAQTRGAGKLAGSPILGSPQSHSVSGDPVPHRAFRTLGDALLFLTACAGGTHGRGAGRPSGGCPGGARTIAGGVSAGGTGRASAAVVTTALSTPRDVRGEEFASGAASSGRSRSASWTIAPSQLPEKKLPLPENSLKPGWMLERIAADGGEGFIERCTNFRRLYRIRVK